MQITVAQIAILAAIVLLLVISLKKKKPQLPKINETTFPKIKEPTYENYSKDWRDDTNSIYHERRFM